MYQIIFILSTGSVSDSSVVSDTGSGVGSCVCVRISSFIENILLLKSLRAFSVAPKK